MAKHPSTFGHVRGNIVVQALQLRKESKAGKLLRKPLAVSTITLMPEWRKGITLRHEHSDVVVQAFLRGGHGCRAAQHYWTGAPSL